MNKEAKKMFIHSVLFEIKPKEVAKYYKDNRMWAACARKAKGFIVFLAMKRAGYKNQYISVYKWKTFRDYDRFTKKFHDALAQKSKSKITLLDRYNFNGIQDIRPSS